ncbi:hypothetical protein BJ878DRAFT_494669 [Calycina marina]|uniref:Uncharacterized protein n=1 Tax=Calycina marina TaxID=1763456 RepID=A0A9P7Z8S7_9HELO|nr:hypothetical protein BJ878DRAFT_494669 [Calycina marina]
MILTHTSHSTTVLMMISLIRSAISSYDHNVESLVGFVASSLPSLRRIVMHILYRSDKPRHRSHRHPNASGVSTKTITRGDGDWSRLEDAGSLGFCDR